jgi:hypothetical protein
LKGELIKIGKRDIKIIKARNQDEQEWEQKLWQYQQCQHQHKK